MGVVYAAVDEESGREVALKVIRDECRDEESRLRFRREGRVAASLDHPLVCRVLEAGEEEGRPFIAMERLRGEPLSDRLREGPLVPSRAGRVALDVLEALAALHERGLVHRDLKPSNVFLAGERVKILDLGLVRPLLPPGGDETAAALTATGAVLGTPRYMSPEQVRGRDVDPRTDLFAAGALLFEMLTGRPAFDGPSPVELLGAILHDEPPHVGGAPLAAALGRVARKAMSKHPADRYPDAGAMAAEVSRALAAGGDGTARTVSLTRVIVLPFRMLRAEPSLDFLAFSLPDALTAALTGLPGLVVRSSLQAARYAGEGVDLARLSSEAQVDAAVTGTLLPAGERLRVGVQLVTVPDGAVTWTDQAVVAIGDVFDLEVDLVKRISASLALPLGAREEGLLERDRPASPRAYEHYLRANEAARSATGWATAVGLYERCLEEDPRFAPAWARLGRVRRLLAKFRGETPESNRSLAESAFRKALDLNPDLPAAHHLFAQFEVEEGRASAAMTRLLRRARSRPNDTDLFVGLVVACRFCGLLDASLAAGARARRLDPAARTSVGFTLHLLGRFEEAIAVDPDGFRGVTPFALLALGRTAEAAARIEQLWRDPAAGEDGRLYLALLGGTDAEVDALLPAYEAAVGHDPEALFATGSLLCRRGQVERGLSTVRRAVEAGLACPTALLTDPALALLAAHPSHAGALALAREGRRRALDAYRAEGGEAVLGPEPDEPAPPRA